MFYWVRFPVFVFMKVTVKRLVWEVFSVAWPRRIPRGLSQIAKGCLEGDDRGEKVVASLLMDAGMELISLRQITNLSARS